MSHSETVLEATIVAPVTPPGCGGVSILRVSGTKSRLIAQTFLKACPAPRYASVLTFHNDQGQALDEGVTLFFQGPYSFTGEDVLEFQGHGSPIVLGALLQEILTVPGVRLARPGEFSERAFLNGKLDLTQAEAVADLISAQSEKEAQAAFRSLKGEFSAQIHTLHQRILQVRTHIEAHIDFSHEDLETLDWTNLRTEVRQIIEALADLIAHARQTFELRSCYEVVFMGAPNAGKSSLLNALLGRNRSIVTPIAGTTRDTIREVLDWEGRRLALSDTAGLRETQDPIEQMGIAQTTSTVMKADLLVWIIDCHALPLCGDPSFDSLAPTYLQLLQLQMETHLQSGKRGVVLFNKLDLCPHHARTIPPWVDPDLPSLYASSITQEGLDAFQKLVIAHMSGQESQTSEAQFLIRARHLKALAHCQEELYDAQSTLLKGNATLDRSAESLRCAQNKLGEITGVVCTQDLLDSIFSTFCLGK